MSRILVTGGSGFIGTNLIQAYLDRGETVANFDAAAPADARQVPYWRQVDILDAGALQREMDVFRPDLIFHMAARTDLRGPVVEAYSANTQGVRNLIGAARRIEHLKRVIFASSMLVCRMGYVPQDEFDYQPGTCYGESKVIGEKIVRQEAADAFEWCIVRPTSIWGPWFGAPYRNFFEAVKKGIYFHPMGKCVRRTYGFVLNSVFELIQLASCDAKRMHGKTFYLADYEPLELQAWSNLVAHAMGRRPIRAMPLFVFKCAAKVGDGLQRLGMSTPPMSSFRLHNMLTDMIHDTRHLQDICGPLPYTPAEGVRLTVEWMRQHG
ncbi:MAG: NAD-dependent epimerase/dehydratase family protein [Nitrospinales bacterium]